MNTGRKRVCEAGWISEACKAVREASSENHAWVARYAEQKGTEMCPRGFKMQCVSANHKTLKRRCQKLVFPKISLTPSFLVLLTRTRSRAVPSCHPACPPKQSAAKLGGLWASRCLGTKTANTRRTSKPTCDKNRHAQTDRECRVVCHILARSHGGKTLLSSWSFMCYGNALV